MNRQKGLTIKVGSPCQQHWDKMDPQEAGRFCSHCKKLVVDFSHLSDQELYNYFSKAIAIPCGRFHNDQLNKIILRPEKRKHRLDDLYKVAATVLAFLSMKFSDASGLRKTVETTVAPLLNTPAKGTGDDKIIITGVVKDEDGHLLENAQVKFADSIIVGTDKQGRFKLEVNLEGNTEPATLLFSYPGLVSTIRNYHPAMLSTTYNVVLSVPREPGPGPYTMGVPLVRSRNMPPLTINSTNNAKTLNAAAKDSLDKLADWLRNNPAIPIKLMTYARDNNNRKAAQQLQVLVKNYLVDQEGISEDRIRMELFVVPGIRENKIEIIGEDR